LTHRFLSATTETEPERKSGGEIRLVARLTANRKRTKGEGPNSRATTDAWILFEMCRENLTICRSVGARRILLKTGGGQFLGVVIEAGGKRRIFRREKKTHNQDSGGNFPSLTRLKKYLDIKREQVLSAVRLREENVGNKRIYSVGAWPPCRSSGREKRMIRATRC